jgi:putative MATE family efflux protein
MVVRGRTELEGRREAMADQRNDFSQGSISKAILSLAAPMTAAQLVNILYSVVDRIYLGRLPGTRSLALTGLGVTMPILSILNAFANLCGMGGAPLCSIHRGRGEKEEAQRVMGNSFVLLLLLGTLSGLVCFLVKEPVLYLFGASGQTFPYADQYLSVYLCGTLFVMVSLGMNPFINSQGFGSTGMLTVALGAAVNLILDPIFIFVLGMGVRGAALATVIAQGCSAAWVLKFLTGKRAILRLRWDCLRLHAHRVGRILFLGLSGFFMSLTNSLVQVVCNKTLQCYGDDLYVGIMTIVNSIREVFFMAVHGLTNGAQPVIGFNYGAKQYSRVRQCVRFLTAVTLGYTGVAWAVIMALPGPLIRLFSSDSATVQFGVPALRIYFCLFLFQALQIAAQSVFVGLGRSKPAVFFSLLRKAVINAPLTVLLPLWGMGTTGVFAAESISQLLGGVACYATMFFTAYRPLGRLPDQPLPKEREP